MHLNWSVVLVASSRTHINDYKLGIACVSICIPVHSMKSLIAWYPIHAVNSTGMLVCVCVCACVPISLVQIANIHA